MITIYEDTASDFTTLGLGALMPSEAFVEEEAGGMYEASLVHPMTPDMRHRRLRRMRIIKMPAPVRETPEVEIGTEGTVTRHIYKIVTDGRRLYLRTGPSQSATGIATYRPGTEVIVTDTDSGFSKVIIPDGGATGWMYSGNLEFVRDETETIIDDTPGTIIKPRQTRDQLFRIYRIEKDGAGRKVSVWAKHITYDLCGVVVREQYAPDGVAANTVVAHLQALADHPLGNFHIYCNVTDPITADYTGRNIINCLLDPEDGIVAQTGARIVRDNFDIFILQDEIRDRGASLVYGKNILSDILDIDTSEMVTRIQPVAKDEDGEPLYINNNDYGFVNSPRIDRYPVIYSKTIDSGLKVDDEHTEGAIRQQLIQMANDEFANGCDLPVETLDVQYIQKDVLGLASSSALHMYDRVPVRDEFAAIVATMRLMGYRFDVLNNCYTDSKLDECPLVQEFVEMTAEIVSNRSAYHWGNVSWGTRDDGTVYHGTYNTTNYRAVYWFDVAALAEKTIESATITVGRVNIGDSSISLHLYGTPVTEPRSNPTINAIDYGVIGTLGLDETKTFILPVEAAKALVTGGIGGLMFDPDTPDDYARLNENATLEITYTEGEVTQMLEIVDGVVKIPRGDDGVINVGLYYGEDGEITGEETEEEYEMQPGDFLTLTVRKRPLESSPVLMQITSTTNRIVITHEDSAQVEVGEYSMDIQLNITDRDRRITVWPLNTTAHTVNMRNFVIKPEVTRI